MQRRKHVADNEQDYIRSVVESLLPLLLPEAEHTSTIVRLFLREALTCRVVRTRAPRDHAVCCRRAS